LLLIPHEFGGYSVGVISHPGSERDRVVRVPDSERELKPLKNPLKI
jgi:hypothetical protein